MKKRLLLIMMALMLVFLIACTRAGNMEKETISADVNEGTSAESSFCVHYIDVGQGDAILVSCDNEYMLIDAGPASFSDLIYSYLKKNGADRIKYMILTHPDSDHCGGLAAAINAATVEEAYAPVTEYDSPYFADFLKYLKKQDVQLKVPESGDVFALGSARCTVLGPIEGGKITQTEESLPDNGVENESTNSMSIVIKAEYGDTSFLFTGDATQEEENSILSSGADLKCDVLKVAHHGSGSSTSEEFLKKAAPEYAVISCGAANEYGHPADSLLDRLKEREVKLFRTDIQGDIICESNGREISFKTEKETGTDTYATWFDLYGAKTTLPPGQTADTDTINNEEVSIPQVRDYILNSGSKKFHYPECDSVTKMAENNKILFSGTRDEVIAMGYEPCGNCHP